MSKVTDVQTHKRLINARVQMVLSEPFFGPLALRLEVVEDLTCDTAWVDGVRLGYSPAFVAKLSSVELTALLLHEVMHCAAGHPWRRDGRDPYQWNVACDRVINPILREAGFKLPDGALFELEPSHLGKSAEWVYARLPQPPAPPQGGQDGGKQGGQGQSKGQSGAGPQGPADDSSLPQDSGGPGKGGNVPQDPQKGRRNEPHASQDGSVQGGSAGKGQSEGGPDHKSNSLGEVRDAPTSDEDGSSVSGGEEEWQRAVVQAANVAKARGKLPGQLARLATAAQTGRVDWRSVLRRFVQEVAHADYSYERPNPRYVASGSILPSLRSRQVGVLAIAIDTSGSVDAVLLNHFASEVRSVVEEVRPREVRVLYCDTRVNRVDTFTPEDVVELKPCGGGGTDFAPVFRHIEDWDEQPVACVYLTDLLGSFPRTAPEYPTLWVTGPKDKPRPVPFGELVGAED